MNKKILIIPLGLIIVLAGILNFRSSITENEIAGGTKPLPSAPVSIANPASIFCAENGGTSSIKDAPDGQLGECKFPNGTMCEEWTLFRGDCNVEGVSNTGHYSDGKSEVKLVYRIKTKTAVLIAPTLGYESLQLAEAVSASGARYLSPDGKVEFWEHQGEGKLSVNKKEIFLGKIIQSER